MTYVEFFDRIATENVSACLTYAPDRVIYIGDDSKLMKKHIANYTKLFSDRGKNIEFIFRTVSKSNLDNAVKVLTKIVEEYDDCVFDITGGEEILNLALGIVYSRFPDRNIQIHKFNLRNNALYDCDKDGTTIYRETPTLSVDENVRIYGGEVAYGDVDSDKTYKWDLTPEFMNDIGLMWDICKDDVRYWNMQIGVFDAVKNTGVTSDGGLTVTASRVDVDKYLKEHKSKYKKASGIIQRLLKAGLLTAFDDGDGVTVTVSFKNKQVKRCLTKAGQALEMKVYLVVNDILDDDGVRVYDDALNGVVIDWDGELHDGEAENTYDTVNEVDVFLMHDVIPVFISCKNGVVTSDELYKLNTVAERFGGPYSKKVLVVTSDALKGDAWEFLRQRAEDMGIKPIKDIHMMSDAEIAKAFKNVWRN